MTCASKSSVPDRSTRSNENPERQSVSVKGTLENLDMVENLYVESKNFGQGARVSRPRSVDKLVRCRCRVLENQREGTMPPFTSLQMNPLALTRAC